jgi:hypothetical protein
MMLLGTDEAAMARRTTNDPRKNEESRWLGAGSGEAPVIGGSFPIWRVHSHCLSHHGEPLADIGASSSTFPWWVVLDNATELQ